VTQPTRRLDGRAVMLGVVLGAALALALVAAAQQARLAPANLGYTVAIGSGAKTVTPNGQIAAIARHYLDAQGPPAEGAPLPTTIQGVTATLARDVARYEAGVTAAQIAQQPDRVVWVVQASGDFLNLNQMTWTGPGAPATAGTIVIDDATDTILGVYPHAP
jgi:hypothetical protein